MVVSASGDSTRDGRIFTGNEQNDNVLAAGVVGLGLRQTRHAVVAVPQDLDAPAVVLLQTQKSNHLSPPTPESGTPDQGCPAVP